MTHSLSLPDSLWQWAQRQAGPGRSPGNWLRETLTDMAITTASVTTQPEPVAGPRVVRYLDEYWMPRPLRFGGSRCNKCGDEFPVGAQVIACRLMRGDGSTVAHYFHPWHVPEAGPVTLTREDTP